MARPAPWLCAQRRGQPPLSETDAEGVGRITQGSFQKSLSASPTQDSGRTKCLQRTMGSRKHANCSRENSFGGLDRKRETWASASLTRGVRLSPRAAGAQRAPFCTRAPPLHSPLSSSRTEPNQTPRRSALSVVEQCHERQQRLARVPQPRVSCDGSQLASRPASRAHSHLAASSLTTPAAHCLRHLRSRHHAAAPVLLPLPQPSASRFRHPLTEAVR